jgi:glycosyltransferase involved in cell wall biosynthesis
MIDQVEAPAPSSARTPRVESYPEAATTALVALPTYNIAEAVPRIVRQALEFAHHHPDYRLVFVDDGSSDGTGDRIESLLRDGRQERVRLVRHAWNRGKWAAIKTALGAACHDRYTYLMFTDGDLAYSLNHLPRLAQALARAEVAIGCRKGPDALDGAVPTRRLMGWLFNRATRACLGVHYRDSQAGLKGFRAEAAERIFPLMTVSDLAFDVEILFLAGLLGFRVAEIPAHVADAHRDQSSTVDIVKDPIQMLASLLKIRMNHARGRYIRI